MNSARLIKDSNNDIYLEVNGRPLDNNIYFKVELFASEPKGKIIDLTKQTMLVDLSGRK